MIYKDTNVFEEALNRIRFVFDNCDDIIVSMSGGKDSTVLFELAMMVAKEKNRLPLKVFWLDQEAEWQATVDYMKSIAYRPDVKPYWFQVPFEFPNNLSTTAGTLTIWNDEEKEKWIHPLEPIAIHKSPIDVSNLNRDDAFYKLIQELPSTCTDAKHCGVLVGMRVVENLSRKMTILHNKANYKGITWCKKAVKNTRVFWPLYDFTNDDIWTAIAKNHWTYNKIYDYQYQWGVPKQDMRVSALIHETAWHSIEMLQEFERTTYNKFVVRMNGVSTFNHSFDEGGVMPKELPFAFKDWKEYRDYLLEKLIPKDQQSIYKNRWANNKIEEGTEDLWYKTHVKELILNDTCGTLNDNFRNSIKLRTRIKNGYYKDKQKEEFLQYISSKNKGDKQ